MAPRQQNHYQTRRGAKANDFQKLREVKKNSFLDQEEKSDNPNGWEVNWTSFYILPAMDFFPSVGQVPQMGFSRVLCMHMCGRPGRQLVGADTCTYLGTKTVRIFSDRIRNRIRLQGLRSVRIRVRISNIWYRIRIQILKSHIYDVDIQSYPIRLSWHYPYSNPNPDKNMKTNVISVISVRIRSVFIPSLG